MDNSSAEARKADSLYVLEGKRLKCDMANTETPPETTSGACE